LSVPIVTSLALGRPTTSAALIAAACVLVFVALRQRGTRAVVRLVACLLLACAAVALAIVRGRAGLHEILAVPFVMALGVVAVILARRERTLYGELLGTVALSSCALPVAFASDVPVRVLVAATIVWVLGFGCATIAVRGVIARARPAGTVTAVAASAAAIVVLAWAYNGGWTLPAAVAPVLAASLALAIRPPSGRRLRAVGWMLVAASAACAVTLVVGLR
jgi:hypothetical protein